MYICMSVYMFACNDRHGSGCLFSAGGFWDCSICFLEVLEEFKEVYSVAIFVLDAYVDKIM